MCDYINKELDFGGDTDYNADPGIIRADGTVVVFVFAKISRYR